MLSPSVNVADTVFGELVYKKSTFEFCARFEYEYLRCLHI